MDTKRGRPREFHNASERQKAYRERRKEQKQASDLAVALLEDVENEIVTLQKTLDYHRGKGESMHVRYIKNEGFNDRAELWVNDKFTTTRIDILVFRHLVRAGLLVFRDKTWMGNQYTFTD